MKYLLLILLLAGCGAPQKWYRITCNKHKGGTALSEKMLLEHLHTVGFKCNNNGAEISEIKNKKTVDALNKMIED